jgi:Family of unknown function (DUF6011)
MGPPQRHNAAPGRNLAGCSLHNPNGYPDDLVREAVLAADVQCKELRSAAAKKAAVTRAARQQKRVYSIATKMSANSPIGPRSNCAVCGRGLGDPESIDRGIGSECWQDVLRECEEISVVREALQHRQAAAAE